MSEGVSEVLIREAIDAIRDGDLETIGRLIPDQVSPFCKPVMDDFFGGWMQVADPRTLLPLAFWVNERVVKALLTAARDVGTEKELREAILELLLMMRNEEIPVVISGVFKTIFPSLCAILDSYIYEMLVDGMADYQQTFLDELLSEYDEIDVDRELSDGRMIEYAARGKCNALFYTLLEHRASVNFERNHVPFLFKLIEYDSLRESPPELPDFYFVPVVLGLEFEVNDDMRNADGMTPLLYACSVHAKQDIMALRSSSKCAWSAKDNTGRDALEIAIVGRCDGEVIDMILKELKDPRLEFDGGRTLFHIWAQSGLAGSLKMISEWFPTLDVNKKDDNGSTALDTAVSRRNLRGVYALLEMDSVEITQSIRDSGMLLILASSGDPNTIVRLMKKGMDIDQPDSSGMTVLMYAVMGGNYDVASTVVELTKNPNQITSGGQTAFLMAAICQNGGLMLARLGSVETVNVNVVNDSGEDALSLALQYNQVDNVNALFYEVPRFKLINCETEMGCYPFLKAVAMSTLEMVKAFTMCPKVDVSVVDGMERNALHFAVLRGDAKILRHLVDIEAIDINQKSAYFGTPLSLAIANNRLDLQSIIVPRLKHTTEMSSETRNQVVAISQLLAISREMSNGGFSHI